MTELMLPTRANRDAGLEAFADRIQEIADSIDMKVSARGWCYILEGDGVITKGQFDRVEDCINECRKRGLLSVDFVAEDDARSFSGIETPETETVPEYLEDYIETVLDAGRIYKPDWWEGEEYYIQMLVEKIDLKTLFSPVCQEYKIPIATSKGWSSVLQRAGYAKRFKEAEENGLKCVLLYCGDHDPDGLRISDLIRNNLMDLADIRWEDGTDGYDPTDLIIERFGLNYDFIIRNNLSWINGLETGSGKNLASPQHKNHYLPYVQDYLKTVGARKCEANALLKRMDEGKQLCRQAIEKYLGEKANIRFRQKRFEVQVRFDKFIGPDTELGDALRETLVILKDAGEEEDQDKDDDQDNEDEDQEDEEEEKEE